jgi:hypothetical protein
VLDRALMAGGWVARRLMLRTAEGRFRVVWRALYAALISGTAGALRAASAEAVYVRGSFARGEPIYGLSDVDLIAIVGGDRADARRLRSAVRRFYERVPTARHVVDVTVLAADELAEMCFSPFVTHAWDPQRRTARPRARFYGDHSHRERFGPRADTSLRLYGPLRRWQLVAGRDVAGVPDSPDAYRWLWSWLDLQFFWKHAFRTCANPSSPQAAYFCTKMVAEPARMWLWLSRGAQPTNRSTEVLEEALRLMPEEERVLQLALSLRRSLPSSVDPPLDAALAWLWRMSARFGDRLAAEVRSAGATTVRLVGGGDELVPAPRGTDAMVSLLGREAAPTPMPLLDWRALVVPNLPDEAFVVLRGDPADPRRVAAAALADAGSLHPALRGDNLLLLPSARQGVHPLATATFRAIQCPATDPVSFALLAGRRAAEFPNLPGWNAGECAERAVLEHAAWLEREQSREPSRQRQLGMVLSAARAALFSESFASGQPELALTVAATVERLGACDEGARHVAEAALDHYQRSRATGEEPPARVVSALGDAVRALPSYRGRRDGGDEARPWRGRRAGGILGA